MTLQITLHIYSGAPDPTWTIDGPDEQEARRLLSNPPDTTRPMPSMLGYRGFSVADPAQPDQSLVRIRGHLDQGFTGAPDIEEFLWRTGGDHVPPFPGHLDIAIPEPMPVARAVTCPPSLAAGAPTWDPNYWGPPNQAMNNCYNYAVNYRGGNRAYPGNTAHNNTGYFTAASMYRGAVSDGLVFQRNFSVAQPAGHYVALVIIPGRDHHWYRQDSNGCWSHKMGAAFPSNLDNSGLEIADPRFCNRGAYALFVSFFLVPPGITLA